MNLILIGILPKLMFSKYSTILKFSRSGFVFFELLYGSNLYYRDYFV